MPMNPYNDQNNQWSWERGINTISNMIMKHGGGGVTKMVHLYDYTHFDT